MAEAKNFQGTISPKGVYLDDNADLPDDLHRALPVGMPIFQDGQIIGHIKGRPESKIRWAPGRHYELFIVD